MLSAERKMRITGSRIGAVLGHNPYTSRASMAREMVLEALGKVVPKQTADIARGHELEPLGIEFAARKFGAVQKGEFGIHKRFDFLGATPDALGQGFVVEVKAPRDIHLEIPQHYYDQMQLQMAVFEVGKCVFVQVVEGDFDYCEVPRDVEFVERNMDSLQSFLAEVNYGLKHHDDFILQTYADELASVRASQKELAAKEQKIKDTILSHLGGRQLTTDFLVVSQKQGITKVDYKSFIKDNNLVIPQDYIKKGDPTWQILLK